MPKPTLVDEISPQSEQDWLRATGETPVQVLAGIMRNPRRTSTIRIQAARALLEYSSQKLPAKIIVESQQAQITPEHLKRLTDEELATFTELVEKLTSEAAA